MTSAQIEKNSIEGANKVKKILREVDTKKRNQEASQKRDSFKLISEHEKSNWKKK